MTQHKWYYYIKGDGPPLIFIHGILGFARNFHSIAQALQGHYCSLLYDQRGHGKSLKSPPHTLFQLTEDLNSLSALLSKNSPVYLVGHSLGGYVALLFTHRYPEKVKKSIIVDSSPQPSPESFLEIPRILNELPLSFSSSKEAREFFEEKIRTKVFSRTLGEFLHANLGKQNSGTMEFSFQREGILKFSKSIRTHNFWNIVKNLKIPTLFLRGELSSYFLKEDFKKLQQENPTFVKTKEIAAAGHWLHQEQKELFIQAVREFLG